MESSDDIRQLSIQLQIPNGNNVVEMPTLIIAGAVKNTSISVPLDDVFDQASQSYQNDSRALHQFSYYLLLQAKGFAQDFDVIDSAEVVNLAVED